MKNMHNSEYDTIETNHSAINIVSSGCSSSIEDSSLSSENKKRRNKTHIAQQRQVTMSRRKKNLRIACWALMDSSASIVTSSVMMLYPSFAQEIVFADSAKGVEAFVIADAVIALSVAILFVVLGGIVDVLYLKRYVAIFSTAISGISCMLLKLIKPANEESNGTNHMTSNIILMLILYSLATFSAQFIDAVAGAFLHDISMGRNVGFISCIGSALGQVVGVVSLIFVSTLSPNSNEENKIKTAKSYGTIMLILGLVLLLIGTLPSFFIHDEKPIDFKRKTAIKSSFKEGWKKIKFLGKYATGNGKILGLMGTSMAIIILGIVGAESRSSSVFLFVTENKETQTPYLNLEDIELSTVISSVISAICSFSIGFISKHFSLFLLGMIVYGIKIVSLILCACLGVCTNNGKTETLAVFWISSILKAMSNGPLFSIMRSIVSLNLPRKRNTSTTTFFLTYALICVAILIGCFISSIVLNVIESERKEIYTAKFFSFPIVTTLISFSIFIIVTIIEKSKKKYNSKTMNNKEEKSLEQCQSGVIYEIKNTESVIQINQVDYKDCEEENCSLQVNQYNE